MNSVIRKADAGSCLVSKALAQRDNAFLKTCHEMAAIRSVIQKAKNAGASDARITTSPFAGYASAHS